MQEDMPPLTTPDHPLNPQVWRVMLLLACVLVFAFALHAKLGVYGSGSQPDASTASKLWTNVVKWEPPPTIPSAGMTWLAVLLTVFLCTGQVCRFVAAPVAVPREQSSRQYLHRFLRPPPVR